MLAIIILAAGWPVAISLLLRLHKEQRQRPQKAVIVPTQHHVKVVRRTKVYDWAEEGA